MRFLRFFVYVYLLIMMTIGIVGQIEIGQIASVDYVTVSFVFLFNYITIVGLLVMFVTGDERHQHECVKYVPDEEKDKEFVPYRRSEAEAS